jgi:Tfp pilus assembly protein PilO
VIVDRNRMFLIAAALTGVVVIVLGFLVGVQPQLSATTAAGEQQANVEAQNAALRQSLTQLEEDNAELPTLKSELGTLTTSVPSQAALSSFLTELDQLADASGTTITGFTSSDAVSYEPVGSDAAATDAATPDASADAPADGATAAPAAPALPTAPELVTDPLVTAANFSSIPLTVSIQGSYAQARDFLGKLQGGSRLFLVTAFASTGSSEGGETAGVPDQWTVGGLVYVLQDAAATQADQAAETPTTTAEGADDASSDTAAGQ